MIHWGKMDLYTELYLKRTLGIGPFYTLGLYREPIKTTQSVRPPMDDSWTVDLRTNTPGPDSYQAEFVYRPPSLSETLKRLAETESRTAPTSREYWIRAMNERISEKTV